MLNKLGQKKVGLQRNKIVRKSANVTQFVACK